MMRGIAVAVVAAVVLGGVPAAHADAPIEQSEKCDDIQLRCLHGEKGVCVVWHDECMGRARPTHGSHKPKKNARGRRHHV